MQRIAHVEIDDGPHLRCFIPSDLAVHEGDQCIVDTGRLLEIGRIAAIEESPDAPPRGRTAPKILRCATLQDQAKAGENAVRSKMARDTCRAKAVAQGLQMRFVRVRYTFGREVLRVLFAAEQNLDCRELVQAVESELRTPVDIRQIGVRDEAGIIGGVGPCGRCLCCCTWLQQFESVNVKMAKVQGLSLNPGAISGNCGRLKCCLRYEFETYRELDRDLPRQGAKVECPEGCGCVIGRDVLAQRVKVRLEGAGVSEFAAEEVRQLPARRERAPRGGHEDPRTQRTKP